MPPVEIFCSGRHVLKPNNGFWTIDARLWTIYDRRQMMGDMPINGRISQKLNFQKPVAFVTQHHINAGIQHVTKLSRNLQGYDFRLKTSCQQCQMNC